MSIDKLIRSDQRNNFRDLLGRLQTATAELFSIFYFSWRIQFQPYFPRGSSTSSIDEAVLVCGVVFLIAFIRWLCDNGTETDILLKVSFCGVLSSLHLGVVYGKLCMKIGAEQMPKLEKVWRITLQANLYNRCCNQVA